MLTHGNLMSNVKSCHEALEILQMPQLDLSQWLMGEIERNPLLELNPVRTTKRFEVEIPAPISLHEHLHTQIRENFTEGKDRLIAEEFVGYLDEKGFLTCSIETISQLFNRPVERILTTLQTFDPPGHPVGSYGGRHVAFELLRAFPSASYGDFVGSDRLVPRPEL